MNTWIWDTIRARGPATLYEHVDMGHYKGTWTCDIIWTREWVAFAHVEVEKLGQHVQVGHVVMTKALLSYFENKLYQLFQPHP